MAIDYAALATTATRLLDENGKGEAVLRSVISLDSDPAAGTVGFVLTSSVDVNAIQIAHNEHLVPGALIETDDKFWMLDTRANLGDEILVDDLLYNVVETWPTEPGDTFIACRAQTRGGVGITIFNIINGVDSVINGTTNVVAI